MVKRYLGQEELAFHLFVSELSGLPITAVNDWMASEYLPEEPYVYFSVAPKQKSINQFTVSKSVIERAHKLVPQLDSYEFGFRLYSYLNKRALEANG